MSHNSKLNIYTLKLKSKSDSHTTFRDLFKVKFNCGINDDDNTVFKKYFEDFLNTIGKDNFSKDDKSKKVLGVSKVGNNEINYSLISHSTSCIIEGVIEGGKYGIKREYADIKDKENKKPLDESNAVLDKFYILINTPLNSKYGFLLVQSYTEETIQESLKKILQKLFCCENYFGNIVIEPFVPQKFVDKFKNEAKIRLFSYTTKVGVSDIIRNNKIVVKGQAFEVEIKLTPIDEKISPTSQNLSLILEEIGKEKFQETPLKEFSQKIFIENNKRKANFDIEKELSSIRPTIYLEDEGISVDTNTSLPNFEEIKNFCMELLTEIQIEFNKNTEINEF